MIRQLKKKDGTIVLQAGHQFINHAYNRFDPSSPQYIFTRQDVPTVEEE